MHQTLDQIVVIYAGTDLPNISAFKVPLSIVSDGPLFSVQLRLPIKHPSPRSASAVMTPRIS